MLDEPYDLMIDVGCLHGLRGDSLMAYRNQVARLLRPGGLFALYVHLRDAADDPDAPTGILREHLFGLFSDGFTFAQVVEGTSAVAGTERPSLWCYLRRSRGAV